MLIGLFFLVNILVVGGAFFLRWRGWRTAHIWMILVAISLLEWLMLVLIRVENINPLDLRNWYRLGEISVGLQFQVTNRNWPIAFSILAALPALLLTGIARLNVRKDLISWSVGIFFIGISFLAVNAADLWALVILWTIFDILEIFYHLIVVPAPDLIHLQRSLIFRFLGSLLLIYNSSLLYRSGINPLVGNISDEQSVLFILAAILHSGILPFNISSVSDQASKTERIIHRMVQLLLVTSSFSILTFFSTPDYRFPMNLVLPIFLFILLLQFGFQLYSGKMEEFNEKWQIFIAVFLIFLYVSYGNLQFWIPVFFNLSLFLILYSYHNKTFLLFPLIQIVLVSGLPYTLNAFGTRGFNDTSSLIPLIVSAFLLALLQERIFKAINREPNEIEAMEPLYQIVYLSGLLVILLSSGLITFKNIGLPKDELSLWWLGVFELLLTGSLIFLSLSKNFKIPSRLKLDHSSAILKILTLDWLFDIGIAIPNRIKNFAFGFSNLLEGAGGILWAIVLLILLLSIL